MKGAIVQFLGKAYDFDGFTVGCLFHDSNVEHVYLKLPNLSMQELTFMKMIKNYVI